MFVQSSVDMIWLYFQWFTKIFWLCPLKLAWKVWWKYQIETTEDRTNIVFKTNGLINYLILGDLTWYPTNQQNCFNLLFIFHRFLELKTYQSMFTNETTIIASTLRNNPAYVSIYLTWMKIIIVEAIPYISILTLNICILKKVYNASKYRQSFRGQSFRSKNSEAVAVSDEDFSTLIHRR